MDDFPDDTAARLDAIEMLLAQMMATLVNSGTLRRGDIVRPTNRIREDLRRIRRDTGEPEPEDVAVVEAIDTIMHMFDDRAPN